METMSRRSNTVSSPERGTGRFRRGPVATAAALHFVHDVYSSFFAPLLPAIKDKLGISYGEAAALNLLRQIPVLANPFVGSVADRKGLRGLLVLGPLLTVGAMGLLGWAPSVWALGLLLMVAGLGAALFHVPAPVLVRRLSGRQVGRGMAYYMVGGETARTLGPLVAAGALAAWGLAGTWRLVGFGLPAVLILASPILRLSRGSHDARKSRVASLGLRDLTPHLRMLAALSSYTFLRALLKSSLTLYLPTYLSEKGEPLWYSNSCLSLLEAAGIAGTFLGGRLSDTLGRRTVLVSSAMMGPAAALAFLGTSGLASLAFLVATGLLLFAPGPVLLAVVQDTQCRRPALLNGLYMSLAFAGSSLAAMLVGLLADHEGLQASLTWAALASTTAALAAAAIGRSREPAPTPGAD